VAWLASLPAVTHRGLRSGPADDPDQVDGIDGALEVDASWRLSGPAPRADSDPRQFGG